MKTPKAILNKLNERKENDSFRSLHIPAEGIDFYSNDYLGIARLESPVTGAHGATGSRLISGNYSQVEELEDYAAEFFRQPAALLFNSGYSANLGLLSCVPQRGDTIIYDEYCHASIRDGIQLSNADAYKFRHNDTEHLQKRLKTAKGTVYVVVEAIYSMDGDDHNLPWLGQICEAHGAHLIVDEAHSGGVYGKFGRGLVGGEEAFLGTIKVFAKIITFGKAFGSHGAMVLGSQDLKDFLINFSRPFIYTTALPPSSISRIRFAIETVREARKERAKLNDNILYFRKKTDQHKLMTFESVSPIQGVIIPGNSQVKQKAAALNDQGFMVKAILSPSVPKGKERIRICLHSYNTHQEIKALIKAFK